MTFKHNKFTDSEVMRSLEKVAIQKGLVKPASKEMKKEASNKLVATGNLTQDIVILCAGLRGAGFNKQANEIESNFIMFKQADTLYQTSKETGEDLVDAAHPDGSHQLSGLKHKVLTITDRHSEILEKVNKKPSGKLATSSQIINAVKTALGESNPEQLLSDYNKNRNSAFQSMKTVINLYKRVLTVSDEDYNIKLYDDSDYSLNAVFGGIPDGFNLPIETAIGNVKGLPSDKKYSTLKANLDAAANRLGPGGFRGVTKTEWAQKLAGLFDKINKAFNASQKSATDARKHLDILISFDVSESVSPLTNQISTLIDLCKGNLSKIEGLNSITIYKKDFRKDFRATDVIENINEALAKLNKFNELLENESINFQQINRIQKEISSIESTQNKIKAAIDAEAKPADAKPADAKPADAKPADAKPAEAATAVTELVTAIKSNIDFFRNNYNKYLPNAPRDTQKIGTKLRREALATVYSKIKDLTISDSASIINLFGNQYFIVDELNALSRIKSRTDNWKNILIQAVQDTSKADSELADDGMVSNATLNAFADLKKKFKISLAEDAAESTEIEIEEGSAAPVESTKPVISDREYLINKHLRHLVAKDFLSSAISNSTRFISAFNKEDIFGKTDLSYLRDIHNDINTYIEELKGLTLKDLTTLFQELNQKGKNIISNIYSIINRLNTIINYNYTGAVGGFSAGFAPANIPMPSILSDEARNYIKDNIKLISDAKNDVYHATQVVDLKNKNEYYLYLMNGKRKFIKGTKEFIELKKEEKQKSEALANKKNSNILQTIFNSGCDNNINEAKDLIKKLENTEHKDYVNKLIAAFNSVKQEIANLLAKGVLEEQEFINIKNKYDKLKTNLKAMYYHAKSTETDETITLSIAELKEKIKDRVYQNEELAKEILNKLIGLKSMKISEQHKKDEVNRIYKDEWVNLRSR